MLLYYFNTHNVLVAFCIATYCPIHNYVPYGLWYSLEPQDTDLLSTTLDTWPPCNWTVGNWTPQTKHETLESRAAPILNISDHG